jgi:hypothetical protein
VAFLFVSEFDKNYKFNEGTLEIKCILNRRMTKVKTQNESIRLNINYCMDNGDTFIYKKKNFNQRQSTRLLRIIIQYRDPATHSDKIRSSYMSLESTVHQNKTQSPESVTK